MELPSRGYRSAHILTQPIVNPERRTSVVPLGKKGGKSVKLSKEVLYQRIKDAAPDWYDDVPYADLSSNQMSRFVEHINIDKEIQRMKGEGHKVLTASAAEDQYRNVGAAPDHRIKFKDCNTGETVVHRVDSRHSRIKESGGQVYVEFNKFSAAKYEAVDWFILTIFAPTGFYDWEISSGDMKQLLGPKDSWRITAGKEAVRSGAVDAMLQSIMDKIDDKIPDGFIGHDLFEACADDDEEDDEDEGEDEDEDEDSGGEEDDEDDEDDEDEKAGRLSAPAAKRMRRAVLVSDDEDDDECAPHPSVGKPIAADPKVMASLLIRPHYKGRYDREDKLAAITAALKEYNRGSSPMQMLRAVFEAVHVAPTPAELDGAPSPPLRLLQAAFQGICFDM